jgi:hypothetical protein
MGTSTEERVAAKIAEINKKQRPVTKKIKRVIHTPELEAKAQKQHEELEAILDNKELKSTKKLELVMKHLKK